jgi:hypothetical protein
MLDRILLFAAAARDAFPDSLPAQHETTKLFGLGIRDLMLLVGIAAVVGLVLFLWVYMTRRERRRHLSRTRVITRAERHARRDESDDRRRRLRKRRPDHPDNLPRNPTLGETGGLPPIRPDEPAQPAA